MLHLVRNWFLEKFSKTIMRFRSTSSIDFQGELCYKLPWVLLKVFPSIIRECLAWKINQTCPMWLSSLVIELGKESKSPDSHSADSVVCLILIHKINPETARQLFLSSSPCWESGCYWWHRKIQAMKTSHLKRNLPVDFQLFPPLDTNI